MRAAPNIRPQATPSAVYHAWTEALDTWFATSGALRMRPQDDEPFFFEVVHDGVRSPHYGRFLTLEPNRRLELTWMNGRLGTDGAETVITVELSTAISGAGTRLRLTHAGFFDNEAAQRHQDAWPHILAHLDDVLADAPQGQPAS